jgi:hypothetical protein
MSRATGIRRKRIDPVLGDRRFIDVVSFVVAMRRRRPIQEKLVRNAPPSLPWPRYTLIMEILATGCNGQGLMADLFEARREKTSPERLGTDPIESSLLYEPKRERSRKPPTEHPKEL